MQYANRILTAIVAFLALPALYVLSVGPAWWLVNCGRLDFRTFTACYDPLVQVADALGLIGWLGWYTELWR